MEDETLPNNFEYLEPEEETNTQELEDEENIKAVYSLSSSKGWKLLKQHIKSQIQWNNSSSKILDGESLAVYGAKRLTADAIEQQLNGILNFVEQQAIAYKEKHKK